MQLEKSNGTIPVSVMSSVCFCILLLSVLCCKLRVSLFMRMHSWNTCT